VAAPLLDRHDQVVGVLYGERRAGAARTAGADSRVAALLVNLLACGVATGLARLEQEQAALKATTLFEQFFTRDLARHLAADPGLLEGREAEVTLLFADVRDFSRHSEKLGAANTFHWVNDVMDELSGCVRTEGGVLADYLGDELMALWGAPEAQPDQAARAVRAAAAMRQVLPVLSQRWEEALGEPLRLGIGLHSGIAHVGNTGSRYKFKYGPLGNTVNLASRVQGLTKYLRCGVLTTAATRWQLDERFVARRVVRARVVNIAEEVDLFEVEPAGPAERRAFFADSQAALECLEKGEFAPAARLAVQLLSQHSGDGPLLLTLARAADALVKGGEGFQPVWVPPGK
jgi:adenylate cyclase